MISTHTWNTEDYRYMIIPIYQMVDSRTLEYINDNISLDSYACVLFLYSLIVSGDYSFYDELENTLAMEGKLYNTYLMSSICTVAEQLNTELKNRCDMAILLSSAVIDVKPLDNAWLVEYVYMPCMYANIPLRRELWTPE